MDGGAGVHWAERTWPIDTESSSMWNTMAYCDGCHGGSVSSSLGAIIGASFMAPCGIPMGPLGAHHIGRAPSGSLSANTLSVWSAA